MTSNKGGCKGRRRGGREREREMGGRTKEGVRLKGTRRGVSSVKSSVNGVLKNIDTSLWRIGGFLR